MAGAPEHSSGREFILPNTAAHVLGSADFNARDAAILQPDNTDTQVNSPSTTGGP
jgi:hypothetical protein